MDPAEPEYEQAVQTFVEAVLADPGFIAELEAFVAPLIEPARIHSLAQTLLKLTRRGFPTSIRAPRPGISPSSIRTTAGRWITSSGGSCSPS